MVGLTIVLHLMAIPGNLDIKIMDLNEPIFAGAENAMKDSKIIIQVDSVIENKNLWNY
jgi:hypothetical protein